MAESLAPPLHKDAGIQGRRRSHPPVRCRDLGFLSEADQAAGAVSPTLLALHPCHQMARLRVKRRIPQESRPAQHTVHLTSSAAALGWPRHKDGRHTHAQSSLLQRTLRRKDLRKCYKDQLKTKRQLAQAVISNQSWQQEPQTKMVGAHQ